MNLSDSVEVHSAKGHIGNGIIHDMGPGRATVLLTPAKAEQYSITAPLAWFTSTASGPRWKLTLP